MKPSALIVLAVLILGAGSAVLVRAGKDKDAPADGSPCAGDCCAADKAAASPVAGATPVAATEADQQRQDGPADDAALPACCAADAVPAGDADPLAKKLINLATASKPTGDDDASAESAGVDQASNANDADDADQTAATPADKGPTLRASQWKEPDQRIAFNLDFDVTDHTGTSGKLADYVDKPTALTFIFTHCPNPNMCPLMTVMMADLEKKVAAAELSGKVRLLMMTYDPVRDTPEVLREYGQSRGLTFTDTTLLRPGVEQFRELLHELAINVSFTAAGNIQHAIEMLIIDGRGRFVRDYQGGVWDNDLVLADLKKLVEE